MSKKETVEQAIEAALSALPATAVLYVAYSGGMDSHVLLHALNAYCQDQGQHSLQALHVNHGLHAQADAWAAHCANICQKLSVPCQLEKVRVDRLVPSLEAAARSARYHVFAECLPPQAYLLMAHHANDQVETVLLHLLRGSGLSGLSGMPVQRDLAAGYLLRPFLHIPYAQLQAYAQQHQLHWIEDDSNRDQRFTRNYLRTHVLPSIAEQWPHYESVISRHTQLTQQALALVEEIARDDLHQLHDQRQNTLSISGLLALSLVRQQHVLRTWLQQAGLQALSFAQLQQVISDVVYAKQDAEPLFAWADGWQIRRYRDQLYLLRHLDEVETTQIWDWSVSLPLMLPQIGRVSAQPSLGQGIAEHYLQGKRLTIRLRQGGERLHVHGRSGSHPLKKLCQEWGVPPWQRARLPLLYADGELVAVVGYAVAAHASAAAGEKAYHLQLTR